MTEQNKSVSVFRETETPEGTTENLNNSKTTGKKSKPIVSGYGAAPGDWNHFDLFLELTEDLLPVVSNPHAVKSPLSKIAGPGKTPSIYNKKGQMAGFPKWTEYRATLDDVEKWSKQPDYGICLQTRKVRAIDVDISDFDESVDVEAFVDALRVIFYVLDVSGSLP